MEKVKSIIDEEGTIPNSAQISPKKLTLNTANIPKQEEDIKTAVLANLITENSDEYGRAHNR